MTMRVEANRLDTDPEVAGADLAGLRILVVEDSALMADTLADMLAAGGVTVIGPVGRIATAVALAQREILDGALLDVSLAGTHAGPVAEVLDRRGIPFIFLTGHSDLSILPDAFHAAPRLRKPFHIHDLQREVARRFRPPAA